MRKFLVLTLSLFMVFGLAACNTQKPEEDIEILKDPITTDVVEDDCAENPKGCDIGEATSSNTASKSFKEYYESMNGKENASGKIHRVVNVEENNVFEIIEQDKLLDLFKSGDKFYLYVGDTKCPWCRLQIESAINVTNELNVDKVYSVNIWDTDGKEVFRDKYIIDDTGELKLDVPPTEAYSAILDMDLDGLLNDYTLSKDDETVEVGEKRIYAPNYLLIENGKIVKFCSPTPEDVEDPRGEITYEQFAEIEANLVEFFTN